MLAIAMNEKGVFEKVNIITKENRKKAKFLDKNKKEVWQGDIIDIQTRYAGVQRDIVVIRDELFAGQYDNNKCLKPYGLNPLGSNNIEVVGNVFDNPKMFEELQEIKKKVKKANEN